MCQRIPTFDLIEVAPEEFQPRLQVLRDLHDFALACFAFKRPRDSFGKLPFSLQKTVSPSVFFDYILLLGCLTFISFVGYIQFQYQVFGNRFGLATFIPMVVLFFSAYYFDQVGVLSLAITNLAAWAGIAATPLKILQSSDFSSTNIIITGLLLGTKTTLLKLQRTRPSSAMKRCPL